MINLSLKNLFKLPFLFFLFLISIFLIKIPSFYYFPTLSKLFSSHTLAKILIIFSSGIYFLTNFKKIKHILNKNRPIFLILGLFFLSQSLSVFAALDISFFLKSYHNLIIALFIFLFSFFSVNINNKLISDINRFIVLLGVFSLFLELIFFLVPYYLIPILKNFIQKEILDSYLVNLGRGRNSLELNTEIFLPFFLIQIVNVSKVKYQSIIASLILIFLTFSSNFRTHVLMVLFVLVWLFFFMKKFLSNNQKIILPFFIILFIFISLSISNIVFKFNITDRFLLSEEIGGYSSLNYRIDSAKKSIELLKSSPLIGIGLGNYINYNSANAYLASITTSYEKAYADLVRYSPHNIFFQIMSETGVFGLITFLILIGFFIVQDIKIILKNRIDVIAAFIISSWTSFIYMLFNPAYSISIIGWFWFMRGIIACYNSKFHMYKLSNK